MKNMFATFLLIGIILSLPISAQNVFTLSPTHTTTNVRGLFTQTAIRDSVTTFSAVVASLPEGFFFNFSVPVVNTFGSKPVAVKTPSLGVNISPFHTSNELVSLKASVGFNVIEFRALDIVALAGASTSEWLINVGFTHSSVPADGLLQRQNQEFFINGGLNIFDTKGEAEVVTQTEDRPLWLVGISQQVFPGLYFGFASELGYFSPVRRLTISYSFPISEGL